jgi:ribose transport system permease protein
MRGAVVTEAQDAARRSLRQRLRETDQTIVVAGFVAVLSIVGALTTDGFLDWGNLSTVARLSSAFGIVAVAEAIVVLGKGIDLSVGAVASTSAAATMELVSRGYPEQVAILLILASALAFGTLNGVLVAILEVPALFATLATGLLYLGGMNVLLLESRLYRLPVGSVLEGLGSGDVLGIHASIFWAGVVFAAAWLVLTFTSPGRLLRAMGDNYETARVGGAPVRPLQIASYMIASLLACFGGYVLLARSGTVELQGSAFNPLLFDALTVVVIGGVSLAGGRGSVLGVLLGTMFVGLVTNLITLRRLSPASQDFVRGAVLMLAVAADAWLHPRDEETAKTDDL